MLKLLLDEHISPNVAAGLRRRKPQTHSPQHGRLESGNFLGQDDSVCLQEAFAQKLTLVTYDRRTIPPLLKQWAEESHSHRGVIFVDEKTISPADIGALVKAFDVLVSETRSWDWKDRILFLRR